MGRYSNFPIIYDEVNQIDIRILKKNGYLNKERSGVLGWYEQGRKTGSISIETNFRNKKQYLRLSYNYNKECIEYEIPIIYIRSNLGKGLIPYFLCPYINEKCRKLYFADGYFLHRKSFAYGYYKKQIQSKSWRSMEKEYGGEFLLDEYYEKLYSKHFKKYYAGKPTKKYLDLKKKIELLEFR